MKMKWNILLLAILVLPAQQVLSQEWLVPPDQSAISNPSEYNLENVKRGKEIYTRNCQSCHGDPGKNNPLALVPLPVDIASERMHANSEGDMFYKITTGRGIMPPFEASIPEDDRWKLINFIMNFKPDGKQLLVDAPPIKAKLLASVNQDKSSVEILAEQDGPGRVGLVNAPVIVSAKKTFGNIELGRSLTNGNGRTEFFIPENVIGDEEGYVSIVVSLGDGYEANEVALEKARVGKNKVVPRLIRGEVLWSTNDNIQLWLLFSYIVAAGGAWLVIGYVIFQIIKIKRYSKSS
jgi:mono/diheme cytochrome c family protein